MDRRVSQQRLLAAVSISVLLMAVITNCNVIQCQHGPLELTINDTAAVGDDVVELEDGVVVDGICDPFTQTNNTLILSRSLRGENCDINSYRCSLICNESLTFYIFFVVRHIDLYPPSFPAALFKANVSEGVPIDSLLFVFDKDGSRATDRDCWTSRSYSFKETSRLFSMESDGNVKTSMPIVYEEGQSYNMTVAATFRAKDQDDTESEATTVLKISVLDADNQPPAFSAVKYILDLKEEHVFPSGLRTVPLIYCRDLDSGINTTVLYNFTESNQYFDIQRDDGQLLQKLAFDRETMEEWQSDIVCYQADDPTKSDTAILRVNITDINDNAAKFDTTFLNVSLIENASSGSYVTEVTATDADQETERFLKTCKGLNAVIVYKISQESSTFQINSDTGVITVEDPELLDRETLSNISLTVYAVDLQGNHSDNNVTVVVHLIDTNDNRPEFSEHVYRFYFNTSDLHFVIGTVTAVDRDVPNTPNSNVTYLVYQAWQDTPGGLFPLLVDHLTGNISINGSMVPHSSYNMIVQACDNPINTADRRCSFSRVIAVYSQNSSFSLMSVTMEVVENSAVGTMIRQIPIRGEHYDVSSTDFIVDEQSHMLKTNVDLDREAVDIYNIAVKVFSDTFGPLGEVNITIHVEDMNDNPPIFDQDEYFFSLPSTPTTSKIIGTLTATDADIGNNSERVYSISLSSSSDLFTIDPVSGTIAITDEWWVDQQSYIQLTVLVSDLGMPSLQSSTQVYITEMLADETTHSIRIGTAADPGVISMNKTNVERNIATLLGIEKIDIAVIENSPESQKRFRSYINITGFHLNGTSLTALELQRLTVNHWTPLQDLFRGSGQHMYVTDTGEDGLKTAEIALIAMAGAILVGAIIAIVVVCKQWNKHMKNQRLYESLRRPSTLYDSQEIQMEFGDENGTGHVNREFRHLKSKVPEEQEGSFGLGYLNTAYLPDETPIWSTNDTPRIPRWSTSDSLKDAMDSLEELTNRLNAEDNISRITSLSREHKSLRSYKSSNDGTPIIDDVQEKHKALKDSDDYITPIVDYPLDKNNVANDVEHETKQTDQTNETEDNPAVFYVNSFWKHCAESAEPEDKTVIVEATAL